MVTTLGWAGIGGGGLVIVFFLFWLWRRRKKGRYGEDAAEEKVAKEIDELLKKEKKVDKKIKIVCENLLELFSKLHKKVQRIGSTFVKGRRTRNYLEIVKALEVFLIGNLKDPQEKVDLSEVKRQADSYLMNLNPEEDEVATWVQKINIFLNRLKDLIELQIKLDREEEILAIKELHEIRVKQGEER